MWDNLVYFVLAKLIQCYFPTMKLIDKCDNNNITFDILMVLAYLIYEIIESMHKQSGQFALLDHTLDINCIARIWKSVLILLKLKHVQYRGCGQNLSNFLPEKLNLGRRYEYKSLHWYEYIGYQTFFFKIVYLAGYSYVVYSTYYYII